ncbi:hypothetical protein ACS0TY_018078 [Phlomoides rotata]
METKLTYAQMNNLNSRTLHFERFIPVECEGIGRQRSGGLCMLWRRHVDATLMDYSSNHVSLSVGDTGPQQSWQVTGLYGWLDRNSRHRTFQLLRRIAPSHSMPWMCMGDFNETFWSWEKSGGNTHRTRCMEEFWETTTNLNLQDLGFSGNKFTWSNGRAGEDNILVRLDRAFANPHWRVLFSGSRVLHLPRINSDHSPILVICDHIGSLNDQKIHKKRLFRFEKMWLENEQCTSIVELGWNQNNPLLSLAERTKKCGERLRKWDKETFGNLGQTIKATRDRIDTQQRQPQTEEMIREIKVLQCNLDDMLKQEETFWFQRSQALWLKEGDRNTSFFHSKASQRKRRKNISRIQNRDGEWVNGEVEVGKRLWNKK